MLHACVQRFDVIGISRKFLGLNMALEKEGMIYLFIILVARSGRDTVEWSRDKTHTHDDLYNNKIVQNIKRLSSRTTREMVCGHQFRG